MLLWSRPVGADYGFYNCNGDAERDELKYVYKQFFAHHDADPIGLHDACIGGGLFSYVNKFVKLKKKFNRLMQNPYPLPVDEELSDIDEEPVSLSDIEEEPVALPDIDEEPVALPVIHEEPIPSPSLIACSFIIFVIFYDLLH